MADANVTMTAPLGPGKTVTSLVLNGAKELHYDFDAEVVRVKDSVDRWHEFEWETVATVTHTISSDTSTIAIST